MPAGLPFPAAGVAFALGMIGIQLVRSRRGLQQLLLPPVAALFFTFGLPLLLTPFAVHVRYVFFVVLIGAMVALYEWVTP
jgi:hypothetical protein